MDADELLAQPQALLAPYEGRLERAQIYGVDVLKRPGAKTHDWFAGDRYSLADVALYAYTHEADKGGYHLKDYPAIGRWLKRVEAQPGYIPLSHSW